MGNPNIIKIVDDHTILIASNIRIAEGLRPNRVVLRHLEDQKKFVTHNEMLRIDVETRESLHEMGRTTYDYVVFTHDGFDNGHYFEYGPGWGTTREEAHEKAKEDFVKRVGPRGR